MKPLRFTSGRSGESATPGQPDRRASGARRFWLVWSGRLVAVAVVLAAMYAGLHGRLDAAAVHKYAERLNGGAAFALLVVLPLLGFPASVLHVAAGLRFGVEEGLMLVGISIGIQLLASYFIVWRFGDRIGRRFETLRRRIPRGAQPSVAVFAVLLPGAPFAAINYVLPLLGIRLRTYLACCWPLHTLRATVTVLLGGVIGQFTTGRLTILGGYALLLTGASAWTYRRLRRQLGDRPATAGDRTQLA